MKSFIVFKSFMGKNLIHTVKSFFDALLLKNEKRL